MPPGEGWALQRQWGIFEGSALNCTQQLRLSYLCFRCAAPAFATAAVGRGHHPARYPGVGAEGAAGLGGLRRQRPEGWQGL